jgi:hypothetical protein
MANMILKAATNKVGSESICDLCVTEEEWEAMEEEERDQMIQEAMWDIINIWTEAV